MTPKQIAVELRRLVDDPFSDEEGELELFVKEYVQQICTALEATDEAAKTLLELRRLLDDPFPGEEGELELFVIEHVEQICTALEAADEAAKVLVRE